MSSSDEATARHNRVATKALYGIVKPIQNAGGTTSEIMVVLESVVAGVLIACEQIDESTPRVTDGMLMALEEGVRRRLDDIRNCNVNNERSP